MEGYQCYLRKGELEADFEETAGVGQSSTKEPSLRIGDAAVVDR